MIPYRNDSVAPIPNGMPGGFLSVTVDPDQGGGVLFSVSALILTLTGHWTAARVVLGLLVVAATLESVFAICLGCIAFGLLMKAGVVPAEVCERCNNIWAELPYPDATRNQATVA